MYNFFRFILIFLVITNSRFCCSELCPRWAIKNQTRLAVLAGPVSDPVI